MSILSKLRKVFLAIVLASSVSTLLAQIPVAVPVLRLGIDQLHASGFSGLEGKRIGLVTNPSGVDSAGISTIQILRSTPRVKLMALFAPEHGIDAKTPAGEYVPSSIDPETGLKVYSLFDRTRKPTPPMFAGLDCIVFDLQDIGVRSYTFISTLGYVMEAAQENGVEMMVLDRPNPLGGDRIEGARLDSHFHSFVSLYDIPYVYGLTVGELALWANHHYLKKPCRLVVVPMRGWRRSMVWEDTGLKWVPTSPNIPTPAAVRGYAATGVLGEVGVSNGANDRFPFDVIASTGIDSEDFKRYLEKESFPGVTFEPYSYQPIAGKYMDSVFSGVKLTIDPHAKANLAAIPFHALPYLRMRFPKRDYFGRRANDPMLMFDKVNGTDAPRLMMLAGKSMKDIVDIWEPGIQSWKVERKPFLLYGE